MKVRGARNTKAWTVSLLVPKLDLSWVAQYPGLLFGEVAHEEHRSPVSTRRKSFDKLVDVLPMLYYG